MLVAVIFANVNTATVVACRRNRVTLDDRGACQAASGRYVVVR